MKIRLMVMMFLQFFIWGSWYATGGNYMKSQGMSDIIYLAYMASPIGSIVSPFFMGMIADRFFPVQRVMGVMHLLSGAFVFCAPILAESTFFPTALFLVLLLLHMLVYMPTVGLATATAFHLLKDKERTFPHIRAFGTIGWIVAGVVVSYFLEGDSTSLPMFIAGGASLVMGVYSFTLPNVPPPGAGRAFSFRDIAGIDALRHLGSRPFLVFMASILLTSIPLATYFAYAPVFMRDAGIANPAFKMTFGQVSEIIFLLLLPLCFARLGVKWVLLTGMIAWILRYTLFLLGASDAVTWMILAGIILHGACYDFVYVAGQVYIDKKATPAIRSQAQGLFVLVSYGIGQGLGTLAAGLIFNSIMTDTGSPLQHWPAFWSFPLLFAVAVTIIFIIGFNEKRTTAEKKTAAAMAGNP